jgi:hypothetical protein
MNVIKRKRYTLEEYTNSQFYQMPKFLFNEEFSKLSNDAKVLYTLLRDRHELSVKNNWIDDDNNIYLIYTRENIADILNCNIKTARKYLNELIKYGLIDDVRQGLNKPNLIYLMNVTVENSRTGHFYQSGLVKNTSQDREILPPINTNNNNTNNNQSINQEDDKIDNNSINNNKVENIKETVKDNICYEGLVDRFDERAEEIFYLIVDILSSNRDTIRVAGEDKQATIVKDIFSKLNFFHCEYVLNSLSENTNKINNIKSYITTSLYNSYFTKDNFYTSEVNHHLYGDSN